MCLLHTQRVRSLPGAVSNPAHLHKQHTKVTCKYHPERRDQAEERFDSLHRGNKPEAPSSFLGRGACVAAPALWVILHWLHQSCAWSQLQVWEQVGPSQPALGVCHGFAGGMQGQLSLGSIPSPAGSSTRGWEHSVPCCGMSGLPSRCLCTERSSFSVPRTSPVSYTYAKFSPCSILW